jgi:DNA-binding transcriptional LysR family regulator
MKPQLNMRQIDAFRCVMLSGSVVGAATLLNVTQPGVSRTLGQLESRLGFALFERRGRRLVPTPEGEALYREVVQIYTGIERIGQIAQDIRFQRAGALRIATMPALGQSLVPRAVARFSKERPRVSFFLHSLPSRQIADLVSTRQFDIGIIELPLSKPGITINPLEPSATVAVMPKDHPLASKKRISLAELRDERMVMLSPHSYVRYQIDDAFASIGVAPHVAIETASSSIACALVSAGAGISLVSRSVALPFSHELALIPLKEDLSSRFALIFPESENTMPLAQSFGNLVRTIMAEDR